VTTTTVAPDAPAQTPSAPPAGPPRPAPGPMVGPSADAPITAVLSWAASLAAVASGPPSSIGVETTLNTVTVIVPSVATYGEWCHLLAVPAGAVTTDTLGAVAHTTARIGGWSVDLVCHVEVPEWAQS
jgi:hypothetical protein